ncbi:hypothetical protein ACCS61_14760 [Rhizobium ruizarguesonis]
MAKRPKPSKPAGAKKPVPGSLGEAIDDAGFQPLGRRIVVGRAVEQAKPQPKWVEPVIDFLSSAMPQDPGGNWEHYCISSLELGCEVLVRLGRATDILGYGAKPVEEPLSSEVSLRWDDVATVMISVAAQMSLLGFRPFPGTRNSPTSLLKPNIRAAHGCGPAYLEPVAFDVFRTLGLILDGSWAEAAETVLWRECPEKWSIDITRDKRFLRAADLAVTTVPPDIAAEIGRVTTITEEDIDNWLGIPERHRNGPKSRKDAVKALEFWARSDLDDTFVRRWRLSHGWLPPEEAARGLWIKLDPLAANMSSAFAALYLPHLPFLVE